MESYLDILTREHYKRFRTEVSAIGGMLRDLGELERRIVSESLALSFIATISAMLAYPLLEGLGLPPLAPQTVAFVLAASFAVGIERFSRRYQ